jgi:hypothetical protein
MRKKIVISTLAVLLFFLILAQCLTVSGSIFQKSMLQDELKNYFIKFKDPPLAKFRAQLEEKVKNMFSSLSEKSANDYINNNYEDYKSTFFSKHENAKIEILKLASNANEDAVILNEFKSALNGIGLRVSSKLIEKIKALPCVESVSQERKYRITREDVIPLINVDDVWMKKNSENNNITGENITVAILDTGIDYNHRELKDNYIGGKDFVNNDDDPIDDEHHGTFCTGIVTAVAPNVNIYAMKVLNENGEGGLEVEAAIEYATDPNGDGDYSDQFIDVISLSLGSEEAGNPDWRICELVDNAFNAGIVVVAAAGNIEPPGGAAIRAPGCAANSICVGATDKYDNIAPYSCKGPVVWANGTKTMNKPDIVAPGTWINSTYPGNNSYHDSGTSFSTPFVAGAAALLLQSHPEWEPADVKEALKESAIDLGYDENFQGAGRIDVLNAYYYPDLPVAILDVPSSFEQGFVDIKGTVKSGTGNPDDLLSYSLYHENFTGWNKIYEGFVEVNDGILMEKWDTTTLNTGEHKLKLIVKTINQTSSYDIKTVDLIGTINVFLDTEEIKVPSGLIYENTSFVVNIFDSNGDPINAFALLFAPFSIPQIRYGSHIILKAPRVLNPFKSEKQGKLIIIKLIGMIKIQHNLTFTNCNNCFV